MFRHKKSAETSAVVHQPVILSEAKDPLKSNVRDSFSTVPSGIPQNDKQNDKKIPASESDLRELMEKNLKWSQIIYEQNRKINRKLGWSAAAGWLRLTLIVIPIILALWLLPPYISQLNTVVQNFTGATSASGGKPSYSIEQILQLLPLGDAEKQQLKAILK